MQALDVTHLPLEGTHLIEASAGTGKTYNITRLYLRLLLERELDVQHLLVMTFTRAATAELKGRLADEIQRAHDFWDDLDEPFYAALRARFPDTARVKARLRNAALHMDEAAIYTIHSFCRRALTQEAFTSGISFQAAMEVDSSALVREALEDWYRQEAQKPDFEQLFDYQPTPEAFASVWEGTIKGTETLPEPQVPELATVWEAFCRQWPEEREAFASLNVASRRKAETRADWQAMQDELERLSDLPWDGQIPEVFGSRFLKDAFGSEKKRQAMPALYELACRIVDLRRARDAWWAWKGVTFAREHLAASKDRLDQLDFSDLIRRLRDQLESAERGPRLAQSLGEQFPVALVDEFQDTDPDQYAILRRIYGPAGEPGRMLCMIGDPKQAIYAFRGADIHTYLQARQDIGERHYTLGRNFRSTAPLVDAVNRLFLSAEQDHPEEGAFLFGRGDDNPLPFLPVDAQGRREWLEVDSSRPTALTAWLLEPDDPDAAGVGTAEYRDRMAAHSADEIVRLLNLAAEDRAGFRDGDGGWRPLRPADIAILVRSGTEAELVRGALEQRRVRSVYLSDRESVYDSPEALDLWRWLRACAEPEQVRYVHGALATATLGLDYRELAALNRDERLLEEQVGLFRDLHHCWQRRGVLATVRRLLDHFQLPARLLAQPGGERALTNILHLAELLQTAGARVEGELALIRFLQERIGGTDREADEQVVRLESDADLVQVVTIHKAKGLQYPLVLVPFPCAARSVKKDDGSFSFQSPDAGNVVELDTQHTPALEAAERERLQEDLRLLYVALTRPMHACWLGVAAVYSGRSPNLHNSALGQLLGCREKTDTGQLAARLQPLARDGAIAVDTPPPVSTTVLQMGDRGADLSPAARCREPVNRDHWWIASYSALRETVAGSGDTTPDARAAPVPESAREAIALETGAEPARAHPRAGDDIHLFPRGAAAGTFLHDLLEWAADEGLARAAADADLRRQFLEPRCHSGHWQGQATLLDRWLSALLTTPLPLDGDPIALADLTSYQPEMEFWFAVADTPVATIDQRVQQAVAPGQARPTLLPGRLGGMMKGFVDLVFEHGGRYWVADYKSNWLGPEDASYSADAMREAVLDKRYDVQYAIYLLALHRLLKARLPGYADDPAAGYERHVGGALYLFLRGIDEPTQHGCYVDKPPAEQIVALDDLLAGREVHHE